MSILPVNSSEEFVNHICRRSFLSLWCYNNPKGKDGDELCDILVVCDPHVVIISVKDIEFKAHKDPGVEQERWQRKAVDASVKQIKGAERWLTSATQVIRSDGKFGVPLPAIPDRKTHRIAVAFGGKGEVLIGSQEVDAGHVHVMEETGFARILDELDTINDFVDYLAAKEANGTDGCKRVVMGSEANLLAFYLLNGRSFPPDATLLLVDDATWGHLSEMPAYSRMKEQDKISYNWDDLIELLSGQGFHSLADVAPRQRGLEMALRTMAREKRFNRRLLGRAVLEFRQQERASDIRTRKVQSPDGATYVMIALRASIDDEMKAKIIRLECVLTRHAMGQGDAVIAVIFVEDSVNDKVTCQLALFDTTNWTKADDEMAARVAASRSVKRTSGEIVETDFFGRKP